MQELEEYIEAHQDSFYRVAFTYVKDRDAALDVVQNAVVQALTHIHCPAGARLHENLVLPHSGQRGARISAEKQALPAGGGAARGFRQRGGDIAERLDVYRAVSALPPKLRTVVVLRFYEDMPLGDIARVTSTNLNTVKSRLYKALAELRRDMAGETQTAGKV